MRDLRSLEERFFSLIRAPEGVDKGLAELGMNAGELESAIVSDAKGTAAARLDIYANMYFYRLLDVLKEDYAKLAVLLGDSAFNNLATDYLLAFPSENPLIQKVSWRLPQFLRQQNREPYVCELADLELARSQLFDFPDDETREPQSLREIAGDDFATLPLPLIRAQRVLGFSYDIAALWDSDRMMTPDETNSYAVVFRQERVIYHRFIDELEAELLRRAAAGDLRFGHVCDQVLQAVGDEQAAVQRSFNLLSQWASDGLLLRLPA